MLRDPRIRTLALFFAVPPAIGSMVPGPIGMLVTLLVAGGLWVVLRSREAPGVRELIRLVRQNRRALVAFVVGPVAIGVIGGAFPILYHVLAVPHAPKVLGAAAVVVGLLACLVWAVGRTVLAITGQKAERFAGQFVTVMFLASIVAVNVPGGMIASQMANLFQATAMAVAVVEVMRLQGQMAVDQD